MVTETAKVNRIRAFFLKSVKLEQSSKECTPQAQRQIVFFSSKLSLHIHTTLSP